jgi:hypothetical protein
MKVINKLLILLMLVISFTACDKDDDKGDVANIAGTYKGPFSDKDGDKLVEEATVTVSVANGKVTLSIDETISAAGLDVPLPLDLSVICEVSSNDKKHHVKGQTTLTVAALGGMSLTVPVEGDIDESGSADLTIEVKNEIMGPLYTVTFEGTKSK